MGGARAGPTGVVERAVAEGAKVVFTGRNADKGAVAVSEMGGTNVHFIACCAPWGRNRSTMPSPARCCPPRWPES